MSPAPGRWRLPLLGLAVVVVAVVLLLVLRRTPAVAAPGAVSVVLRQASAVDRADLVVVSGEVEASRSGSVGFQVPGRVAEVGPDEGQIVHAGDLLALLDTTEYQLQLQMAAAAAREVEDQYRRLKEMYDQKGIPPSDFVKVESGYQQATAQLALVRKHLSDAHLRAPLGGVLARRGIEVGEQAAPGMPVFTIVATDPVRIRVGVPEAEVGRIRIGQTTEVRVPALPEEKFEGRVSLIGIAADPVSRTYTVKITVANPRGVLRPGMIAEARIRQDTRIKVLTVPASAIVPDADGATLVFVYFPTEHRVYSRRVTVGTVYGKEVEVSSGLTASDMIVVAGQDRVREGSPVEVTGAAAADAPAAGTRTP